MGFFKIGLKKKSRNSYHLLETYYVPGIMLDTIKVLLCEEKNSLVVCFDAGALRVTEYFFHSG